MADPLSITAGIIAVLGAIEGVSKTLGKIKNIRNAPQELLALINEVSDLKLIFADVQSYVADCTARRQLPQEPLQRMSTLAKRARNRLLELDELIQYRFTKAGSTTDQVKVSRREWARARSTIETFRQSLRDIRLNIVTQMIVINSTHQSRIALTIDEICIISGQLQINNHHSGERTVRQLEEHSRLLANILSGQSNMQGLLQLRTLSDDRVQVPAGGLVAGPNDQSSSSILRIRAYASQTTRFPCTPRCGCTCHNYRNFRSLPLLHKAIGTLFIGYTGCPLGMMQKCTDINCLSQSMFRSYVQYVFPYWLIAKALTITYQSVFPNRINVSLNVRHVVSSGAEVFRLVDKNDVDGVRRLFDSGLASPNDSTQHGATILSITVYNGKLDVCRFLLQAGADPHLEMFAGGRSAFESAWNMIFQASDDTTILESLRSLFPDNGNHLDERRLSKPQKIILDLDGGSLEDELKHGNSDVDAVDSIGYTALMWAARRRDHAAVNLLLKAGADPNIRPKSNTSALLQASRIPNLTCVKLLLGAGADPTSIDNYGKNVLHYAAEFQDRKEIFELLVKAGADLENRDNNGATPLAGAALRSRSALRSRAALRSHAVSANALLDLGANINHTDFEGCTPLHESLFHNADDVTRLLIQRGAEFTTNIYGDTNLHLAALSGGISTLCILRAATKLGTLDPDACDKKGRTALQIARERVTKPEGFVAKFQELLGEVRRQRVASSMSPETGNTGFKTTSGPDPTLEDVFVDASEEPQPATISRHARPSLLGLMLSCITSIKLLNPDIWNRRLWSKTQLKLAQSVWLPVFLSWLLGLFCAGLAYWVFGPMGEKGGVGKGVSVIYLGGRDEV